MSIRYEIFYDNLLLFVIIGVVYAEVATYLCYKYSISAEGSGIAEIKAWLSGTQFSEFITM